MLITALSMTAKKWKPPKSLLPDEYINKILYTHLKIFRQTYKTPVHQTSLYVAEIEQRRLTDLSPITSLLNFYGGGAMDQKDGQGNRKQKARCQMRQEYRNHTLKETSVGGTAISPSALH